MMALRWLLVVLFFSLVGFTAEGQSAYVKSNAENLNQLHAALAKCKPDTNKLRLLLNIASVFYSRGQDKMDIDSAIYYLKQGESFAMKLNDRYFKNQIYCRLGEVMLTRDMQAEGKAYFFKAISGEQAAGDILAEAETWQRFGAVADFKTGIMYLKKAISLFHRVKNLDKEIDARLNLALLYRMDMNYRAATATATAVIREYQPAHRKQLAYAHYILSALNRYDGNFNISLYHILKGVELVDMPKDSVTADRFYGELGLVYQALGNTEKSIYWYRKTVAIREKMHNLPPVYITRTVGFIVQQLISEKKTNEALQEALSTEKRIPPVDDLNRAVYGQMKGECYAALKRFDLAERCYRDMMPYLNTHPEVAELTQTMNYDLAKLYIDQDDYTRSAVYIGNLSTANFNITLKKDIELLRFKQDSAARRLDSAILHLKKYKALSDSIFNVAKSGQFEELQIKYQTNEKEKDISLKKKTESLQRDRIAAADRVRNLTFGCIGLLVILVLLLLNGYRLKQRTNNQIRQKNESLNNLLGEKDNLLKEKEWLIKEIHHRVKNNLQIVMGLLQRQSAYIDNEAALKAIQNSESRMHAIALIHQKLYQSENLDQINMPEYVSELVSYLGESADTGSRISFEKKIENIYLAVSQAVPLGLIMNEAITNAIKYAYGPDECGVIRIALMHVDDEQLTLTIQDEGRGLPVNFDINKVNSLGMSLVKGLSKQINGVFEIINKEGVGIQITFKVESTNRQPHNFNNA